MTPNLLGGSTELAVYQPLPAHGEGEYQGAPESSGESLWSLVDDRMRGRWRLMIILGTLLSASLVVLAWLSAEPTYRSNGAVRIQPKLSPIMVDIPETRMPPDFTMFKFTQVQFLQSRRVLENAAKSEALRAAINPEEEPIGVLMAGLKVTPDPRSELIFVAFMGETPEIAQAGVNAVIESYDEIYGRAGGDEVSKKLKDLKSLEDELRRELRLNRAEQQRVVNRYESLDLPELQSMKLGEIREYETRMADGQMVLDATLAAGGEDVVAVPTDGFADFSLEDIDPRLAQLRIMMDEARTQFDIVRERYKTGTGQYVRAEKRAETAQMLYAEEYQNAINMAREAAAQQPIGSVIEFRGLPAPRIKQELEALTLGLSEAESESQQIISDIQSLTDLATGEEQIQLSLSQAQRRMEQLELEEETLRKGRISVAEKGHSPRKPFSDPRRKRVAVGAAFGYMLSFGLFFLLGTIDRRAYGSAQLRQRSMPNAPGCLGVLPDLGRSLRDPESSDVAAHCVHQIRNQIEAIRGAGEGYVLAISSPYQGDGKTSIVMALGWSYAAAGFNTLMVDCDLVGRSLTRQLGMIGRQGLKEVLRATELNGQVAALHVDHLSVLPVGVDARFGPETIRRLDLERLFDQVRNQYDIIIVDTGPMLGSLESTPVTAAADGVVLSVRRGRSRTRLEDCVSRLAAVGGRYLGVILNCATRTDCDRYVSEASLTSMADDDDHDIDSRSLIHASEGEQNALMVAMESTTRGPDDE